MLCFPVRSRESGSGRRGVGNLADAGVRGVDLDVCDHLDGGEERSDQVEMGQSPVEEQCWLAGERGHDALGSLNPEDVDGTVLARLTDEFDLSRPFFGSDRVL